MRLEPPLEHKMSSSSSTSHVSSLSSPLNSLTVPYMASIGNNKVTHPVQLSHSFSSVTLSSKTLDNTDQVGVKSVLDVRGREFKQRQSKFYLPTTAFEDPSSLTQVQKLDNKPLDDKCQECLVKKEAFAIPPPPKMGHRKTKSLGSNVLSAQTMTLLPKSVLDVENEPNESSIQYSQQHQSTPNEVKSGEILQTGVKYGSLDGIKMSSEEKPCLRTSSSSHNKLMTQSMNGMPGSSRIKLCLMDDSVLEEETLDDFHPHFDCNSNPSIIAYEDKLPLIA